MRGSSPRMTRKGARAAQTRPLAVVASAPPAREAAKGIYPAAIFAITAMDGGK